MPLPNSSKKKSARTWWGYHARASRREQWLRRWWLIAALIGCAAWLSWWLPSPRGSSSLLEAWAAPGKLASPHQAWNHECEACHQPFQPISSNRSSVGGLGDLAAAVWQRRFDSATADEKCQHCHAAPAHHSNQLVMEVGKCADCHEDHRGLTASLVELDDSKCLRCHEDLKNHAADPRRISDATAVIREFGTRHPEFHALIAPQQHQRGLKFSHAVHMLPGMGLQRVDPLAGTLRDGGPFTYGDIQAESQSRYLASHGDPAPAAAVQLVCADCHRLDAGTAAVKSPKHGDPSVPRGDGRYYLPIVYEQHCQACHPLGFDPTDPTARLDHRLQPAEVEQRVLDHFSRKLLTEKLRQHSRKPEQLRLDSLADLLTESEQAALQARAQAADADLYALLSAVNPPARELLDRAAVEVFVGRKTCGECHTAEFANPDSLYPTKIDPVNVPAIWQSKAVFDHLSHQALNCQVCHPHSANTDLAAERQRARDNNPQGIGWNVYQHPPDLPDLESCRVCHSRRPVWSGDVRGGVSQRCTDCHTYHNTEHGLQGRGARTLLPEQTLAKPQAMLRPRTIPDTPVPMGAEPK